MLRLAKGRGRAFLLCPVAERLLSGFFLVFTASDGLGCCKVGWLACRFQVVGVGLANHIPAGNSLLEPAGSLVELGKRAGNTDVRGVLVVSMSKDPHGQVGDPQCLGRLRHVELNAQVEWITGQDLLSGFEHTQMVARRLRGLEPRPSLRRRQEGQWAGLFVLEACFDRAAKHAPINEIARVDLATTQEKMDSVVQVPRSDNFLGSLELPGRCLTLIVADTGKPR